MNFITASAPEIKGVDRFQKTSALLMRYCPPENTFEPVKREQNAIRYIIRNGRCGAKQSLARAMAPYKRTVLMKLANLHFHHAGRTGWFEKSRAELADACGLAEDSVKKACAYLRGLGILRVVRTGRGRGNKTRYCLDLAALVTHLWPDFHRLKKGGQRARVLIQEYGDTLGRGISLASFGFERLARAAIGAIRTLTRRLGVCDTGELVCLSTGCVQERGHG